MTKIAKAGAGAVGSAVSTREYSCSPVAARVLETIGSSQNRWSHKRQCWQEQQQKRIMLI